MRGKFTICSIKFHVNFFQWCRIMRLEYVIKCRLSTRKWHVMGRSLMWQNGIWLVEYISSKWTIASCSCSAMIGYVVIGLWMMFSQYVMEFKLFRVCIVRKGAEKTRFIWKNYTINANLSYSEKISTSLEEALERQNHKTFQMSPRFLVNVILCAQPPDSMTSFTWKQYPNAVIGAWYANAVIWLVRHTYPYAAIWLVRDTNPNATIWLVRVTYHSTR